MVRPLSLLRLTISEFLLIRKWEPFCHSHHHTKKKKHSAPPITCVSWGSSLWWTAAPYPQYFNHKRDLKSIPSTTCNRELRLQLLKGTSSNIYEVNKSLLVKSLITWWNKLAYGGPASSKKKKSCLAKRWGKGTGLHKTSPRINNINNNTSGHANASWQREPSWKLWLNDWTIWNFEPFKCMHNACQMEKY